ncbi:DivIVA domain-containing protein [Glaciibacter psychrotolerans]|uniref:DivIVA domain-containing protein n=1 Tax=Glaciibacter psychrotolerans TaxID=670054 RepID=A0A7Z0J5R9_9MICO|nr:DivIVA domain-containing protein [Leifsonia psychrotolerans]
MSTTFPRTGKKTLGYAISQVDDFLASARQAYDAAGPSDTLTAQQIRATAFSMAKNGYSAEHVDAALERLEDAFAARERAGATQAVGEEAWLADAQREAQVLVARLRRPGGKRFARTSFLSIGYNRTDVDRFSSRLVKYFDSDFPLTADDVRGAVFRPQRGGYRENQVDAVLDSVVDVMLAVR